MIYLTEVYMNGMIFNSSFSIFFLKGVSMLRYMLMFVLVFSLSFFTITGNYLHAGG